MQARLEDRVGVPEALIPGRTCPLAYRYGAASLARPAELEADALYVAGGLYGNPFALDTLLAMVAAEPGARLAFNGDFNWFDRDDDDFVRINQAVLAHHALRGNVETELLSSDAAAGCGCGYPESVSDADVARSNAIMGILAATARRHRVLAGILVALPMTLVARVGGARVGIVHGDADSLAGWQFGEEALLSEPVVRAFDAAQVDVFASSHTCAAVAQTFAAGRGTVALINNGAAGMPNFAGTRFGLATRIGIDPAPMGARVLHRARIAGVHVEALAIEYDADAWLARFDAQWPADSPAALSYRRRIAEGPAYGHSRAVRGGFRVVPGRA